MATSISELLSKIMDRQETYERDSNHIQNIDRLKLLQELSTVCIEILGSEFGDHSHTYKLGSDVSKGVGGVPIVSWCRFTDLTRSKSAQRGFYIVFLFSEGGDTCFLSLNQGSDGITGKVASILQSRVFAARKIIGASSLDSLELTIDLNTSGGRGRNYELGHICGFRYSKESIPDHNTLISHIRHLLNLLAIAYTNEESIMGSDQVDSHDRTSIDEDPLIQLAIDLNWDIDRTRNIVDSLTDSKPQVIFGGPPGTGKTFAAERIASYLVERPELIEVVQFHPSYGYEDFVEGLRPTPLSGGGFEFKRVPGVVTQLSNQIREDGQTRVLIIDEINRANIARVFGELMYLLEYRNKAIRLMLENEKFSLPSNLIIIGTMNTADRSTRSLDIAMRRRFRFFELLPDVEILKNFYNSAANTNELGHELFSGFQSLNSKLRSDLDKHFMVGHSYFMRSKMDSQALKTIWDQEIFPLIEEYFFDNDDRTSEYSINAFWPSV